MTQITLSGVYLAPVSDLSDLLILNAGVKLTGASGVVGEFRRYAGGVTRLIQRTGGTKTATVTATRVSRTTREKLAGWVGVTLLLRDGRGRCIYGSFLSIDEGENPGPAYCDVSFAFNEITTSEVV
jgi:hypothetical protein